MLKRNSQATAVVALEVTKAGFFSKLSCLQDSGSLQRGQTRKAPEGSGQSAPAAKAQKAVGGDMAQQANASFADVVAGRVPEQQIIPVLLAKIQQLEQLVQNHINNSRRDDFLQFRRATSARRLSRHYGTASGATSLCLGWQRARLTPLQMPWQLIFRICCLRAGRALRILSGQLRLPLGQMEVICENAQSCARGAYFSVSKAQSF